MGRIKLLPLAIAQKIAAGEVIERPASVVKELVENSLDAAAKTIRVELEEGGKKLIRVEDDGCGLSAEDVVLCFERHATSKISQEEDLEKIATLGFRGEALASIASVSRLVMRTSEGLVGTRVEREGGRLLRIAEGGYPKGTSVEVRDLFFNLPARRKFLRSVPSELTQIVRYLTTVSLAFPEVAFFLRHGQRQLLNCPAVTSRRERFYQLFGRENLERLMEINWAEGEYQISGFISRPPLGVADRYRQFYYVNVRPVRDRLLPAAVQQAMKGRLEKDTWPEVYLFLSLPYVEVDVNVHPAKAEVRFRDAVRVFHLVLNCLNEVMTQEARAKSLYPGVRQDVLAKGVRERAGEGGRRLPAEPEGSEAGFEEGKPPFLSMFEERELAVETKGEGEEKTSKREVLGQYLNLYILATDEAGLLIIDQHNAHERILFEKYLDLDARQAWSSKQPLFPLLIELSPAEMLIFEELKPTFVEFGFELENLGGRSLYLRSFPDFLQDDEAREVLRGFLEEAGKSEVSDRRERLLATMACRTAIKAGLPLSLEKMEVLVDELFRTKNPWLCPHGRPIMLRLERSQIEKGLKRPSN